MSDWQDYTQSRRITERLIIRGDLTLLSPAQLGNGDSDGSTDMPLLLDALEERPLLTGSSLAGALRAHLLAQTIGYCREEQSRSKGAQRSMVELLFGGAKGDEEGDQSPLIVDDALAEPVVPEIRDGVRIDSATRTALAGFKFDAELLPPGTVFPLRLELLLSKEQRTERIAALVATLQALETGEIRIGGRKTRGFGRCHVTGWRIARFNLRDKAQLRDWLTLDEDTHPALKSDGPTKPIAEWKELLGAAAPDDARELFSIEARFVLASPLLIRAELPLGEGGDQPDFIQLRDGLGRPVISGTSLAGALRARALRILNTLGLPQEAPDSLFNSLFGKDMRQHQEHPTASRLIVEEAVIDAGAPLVQNRVSIDRFTGGAFDTALFSEAPHVGGEVTLHLQLRNPREPELGLLLLLLKDLWTSDLALGGASSVGRGRLQGRHAVLRLKRAADKADKDEGVSWTLTADGKRLVLEGDREALERWVAALRGDTRADN